MKAWRVLLCGLLFLAGAALVVHATPPLLLLSTTDDSMSIYQMNADGKLGRGIRETTWSTGWTSAEFYTIGAQTYLFLYKSEAGQIHIDKVNTDGTIGDRVMTLKAWYTGFTTVRLFTIGGNTYLFMLNADDRTMYTFRMDPDGTMGDWVAWGTLSAGWTEAEFFTVAGATYLLLLDSTGYYMEIRKVNANGTIGHTVCEALNFGTKGTIARIFDP